MIDNVLEERINELEVRISFQDSTIAELDAVLRAQRDEMDSLKAKLQKVIEQQAEPDPAVTATHEKPPHY